VTTARTALVALLALPASAALAAGLGGSRTSMIRQHAIAVKNDFMFARTSMQLRQLIDDQRLVPVHSTSNLLVTEGVSFAYTRPIVKLFLDRMAAQYFIAMGERLVVTSLTRPIALQPRNASPLSVHPAGMAIDLRIPSTAAKRAWLEQTLLALEDKGVIDVTRERRPAHYHVAVFPTQYGAYLASQGVDTAAITLAGSDPAPVEAETSVVAQTASIVSAVSAPEAATTAAHGLRYLFITAAGYFLAVFAAGLGTRRKKKAAAVALAADRRRQRRA
jgi:hypothetical protein